MEVYIPPATLQFTSVHRILSLGGNLGTCARVGPGCVIAGNQRLNRQIRQEMFATLRPDDTATLYIIGGQPCRLPVVGGI